MMPTKVRPDYITPTWQHLVEFAHATNLFAGWRAILQAPV
jgi:hypothetical protein